MDVLALLLFTPFFFLLCLIVSSVTIAWTVRWGKPLSTVGIIACATILTICSGVVTWPLHCDQLCIESDGPCPPRTCVDGQQRAGFPVPIISDNNGGGSPLSSLGKIDSGDHPEHLGMVANILLYSGCLRIIRWMRRWTVTRRASVA